MLERAFCKRIAEQVCAPRIAQASENVSRSGPSSPAPGLPVSGALGRPQGAIAAGVQRDIRMREVAEAADRGRTSEQISLYLVAQFVVQELQFSVGLDAFREHGQAKSATKAQYRPDNRRGLAVGIDRFDEGTVDLDPVERKRPQGGQ